MMRKRSRSMSLWWTTAIVILSFFLTGCFFDLREKDNFESWYYGDPGLAGALDEKNCDRYADNIEGQRHPYYLHFRTPEILLQPQGGRNYPERQTAENRAGGFTSNRISCEKVSQGWETFRFDVVDAGLVDTVIPYRKSSAINDREEGGGRKSLNYAQGLLSNSGLTVVMKAPVYIVHDILKTLYIPVAGTYYLFKPDEPPERSTEIIQVRGDASAEGTPPDAGESGAMATAKTATEEFSAPVAEEPSGTANATDRPRAAPDRDGSVAIAQAAPEDDALDAPNAKKAGQPPIVDGEGTDPQPFDPTAKPRADAALQAAGEEAAVADQDAGAQPDEAAPGENGAGASVTADSAGRLATESGAAPAPIADASDEDPASKTAADAHPATDAARESDAAGEALAGASEAPADAPEASGAHEADTTQAQHRTPAEQDQAPSSADEEITSEPSPPDTDSPAEPAAVPDEAAAAAAPGPPAADTARPGETERGARKEQDPAGGQGTPAAARDAAAADSATMLSEEDPSSPRPRSEQQAEEDRVDAAVTRLGTVAQGAADSEGGTAAPPAAVEPSGEIHEEDLLAPVPAGDASPAREVQDTLGDAEGQGTPAPAASDAASDPLANVTPDQSAVAPAATNTPETIRRTPLFKKTLRKKVAFLGFHSRAANVDEQTRSDLQAYVWPVFGRECRENMVIVRRGDADYPGALDSLMRDQFGRMNSFELITLARFSGLNAIVAGTIIDIRVANALSGVLWYKSPEGQLRVTIQVELFDAETGTKLFDHTYVREEEVEELEPGAGENVRKEDLPVLEAILKSVAEEVGEDICDALEDQPWRAFISGIDGNRITLSAGQGAGLKPGNVLGVYNSQIIDGLNNQQFFLTGEKVGRIQLLNVYPNRSEAILIEGRGVRDYSVAMPD
ncbi:MAG: hypothetical protein QNI97_06165 [Desulfobacterales bacterium]|nr:hypothetical protein [Desulfobacterales bacterium]